MLRQRKQHERAIDNFGRGPYAGAGNQYSKGAGIFCSCGGWQFKRPLCAPCGSIRADRP
ncbi:MAG: SWIM zinc finger family protein [Treponema sp.]|nr:SWIM zinc finger family protein [Treponema sp.]